MEPIPTEVSGGTSLEIKEDTNPDWDSLNMTTKEWIEKANKHMRGYAYSRGFPPGTIMGCCNGDLSNLEILKPEQVELYQKNHRYTVISKYDEEQQLQAIVDNQLKQYPEYADKREELVQFEREKREREGRAADKMRQRHKDAGDPYKRGMEARANQAHENNARELYEMFTELKLPREKMSEYARFLRQRIETWPDVHTAVCLESIMYNMIDFMEMMRQAKTETEANLLKQINALTQQSTALRERIERLEFKQEDYLDRGQRWAKHYVANYPDKVKDGDWISIIGDDPKTITVYKTYQEAAKANQHYKYWYCDTVPIGEPKRV